MHSYTRPTTIPDDPSDDRTFRSALDVQRFAECNPYVGAMTFPEVWHLDAEGRHHCGLGGCTSESLLIWAADPYRLRRSRAEGLRSTEGCQRHWVIVDSRPIPSDRKPVPPTEAEAEAFGVLRRELRSFGVDLVDAIVFDHHGHWWSMHELTSGTTTWDFVDDDELARASDPAVEMRDDWDRPWLLLDDDEDEDWENWDDPGLEQERQARLREQAPAVCRPGRRAGRRA